MKLIKTLSALTLCVALLSACAAAPAASPSASPAAEPSAPAQSAAAPAETDAAPESSAPAEPSASPAATPDDQPQGSAPAPLTEQDAQRIALEQAGVSADSATNLRVKLDRDDGREEYEVEFRTESHRYDCDVDAATGEVRSYECELRRSDAAPAAAPLTEQDAQRIALEAAGVSADSAADLRIKLDHDDGREEYEVEFRADGRRYDCDIDAATGEMLSWSFEVK